MPRRKRIIRRRKPIRRRRVRGVRRHKKYNRIQTLKVRQPGAIVPDRLFTRLMYWDSDSSVINAASSIFGYLQYNANGAFDPNPLLSSASTKGFSQMAQLYNRYRVHGCKILYTVSNQNTFPITAFCYPSNQDLSGTASFNNVMSWTMQPYCRHRMISPVTAGARTTFKYYMSTKKIMGYTGSKYDDTTSAQVVANPTNAWYWNIGVFSPSSGQTMVSSYFDVKITYYIEFYDRKTLTGLSFTPTDEVPNEPPVEYPDEEPVPDPDPFP